MKGKLAALALALALAACSGPPAPAEAPLARAPGLDRGSPPGTASTVAPEPPPSRPALPEGDRAVVTRVVDGDTVHVDRRGRDVTIRLIGVDTPETVHPRLDVQCFGREASRYVKRLLDGERVVLVYDVERLDRYGRTLAYVWRARDVLHVNLDLVRRGFATVLTVPPNVAHAEEFVAAQRRARDADLGLWGACEVGG